MMRRRTGIGLLAGVLLAGLVAVPGPVGAQEFGVLELGSDRGSPGDVVQALVDPGVVAESCVTDLGEFMGIVLDLYAPPNGPLWTALEQFADDQGWPAVNLPPDEANDPFAFAYYTLLMGTGAMAGGFLTGDIAAEGLASSFVLTFADPVTQDMAGDMGSYDPVSGEGEIVVPHIDPGLWAVAAVCLGFNPAPTADGTILPAVLAGEQWVIENLGEGPYPGLLDPEFAETAVDLLPVMLGVDPFGEGMWLVQGGPWVDLFCILQPDGFCATPPDPVGLLAELSEEELAEFADSQAGDSAGDGDADPDGLAVEPVSASPAFTG